jgi:hypothetical protein
MKHFLSASTPDQRLHCIRNLYANNTLCER